MARLLFITDFTEQFAYRLLSGIIDYAGKADNWVVCRMPPAYKQKLGIQGVVTWAKKWKADVVIGQFDPGDDVSLFKKNGMVVLAQDYITKFEGIPNITADYDTTGRMAAEHFLARGFRNFAFFGYKGVCWSEERLDGFRARVEEAGYGDSMFVYDGQRLDSLWYYESAGVGDWLKMLPKPVAVMACDDNQGSLLLEACNSNGIRIPDDVAVIGVDNDEVLDNLSNPSLSSIDVDIEKGGVEAAAMAVKMMADPDYAGEDIILHPVSVINRMSTSVFATKDKEVVKALQFISRNVENKILVPDILKEVPLSRRLLETRFKKVTGYTIYSYISRQRIEHFAELLLRTNDSVSEIAARMDEPDTKSICRRFKAIKGCTPTEYRARELRKLGV